MEVFLQQLINGVTLGSIYGLIAIGYTMVFGIIGMVESAHGDVFMVSAFIALVVFLLLVNFLDILYRPSAAHRADRGDVVHLACQLDDRTTRLQTVAGLIRLAPLISAIGMSIFLSNFVQVTQGPCNKSILPMVQGEFVLFTKNNYAVTLSFKQIIIWGVTAVLLKCAFGISSLCR